MKLFQLYLEKYQHLNFKYINIGYNSYKVNKISNNKFHLKNYLNDSYLISNESKFLFIDYNSEKISTHYKKKTYFKIDFISNNQIIIHLGIYKLNRYNITDNLKNRNLLIKLLYNNTENIITMIPKNNLYYLQFLKSKLYLTIKNNLLTLSDNASTLWKINKYKNTQKIYAKRIIKNKKIYYRNLETNNLYTNFYLGWGNENIISIE